MTMICGSRKVEKNRAWTDYFDVSGDSFAEDGIQSIILNISYASLKESKCSVLQCRFLLKG